METSAHWLPLAAILIVAELLTGTFYLLVIGLSFAAGGVAELSGANNPIQDATVLLTMVIGLTVVTLRRQQEKRHRKTEANSLDIGQPVTVSAWQPDGSARVVYRGSDWNARWIDHNQPPSERCIIQAIEGNTLLLTAAQHLEQST